MDQDEHSSGNLLTILGVQNREDVITSAIAYCFNRSPDYRRAFLAAVGLPGKAALLAAKAHTRMATGSSGVPDLVIAGKAGSEHALLVVENKMAAMEGDDQTARYASQECRSALASRYDLDASRLDAHYVLLTLFPDQPAQAPEFRGVTYQRFLEQSFRLSPPQEPWVTHLVQAWNELLAGFYTCGTLDPSDHVLAKLQTEDPLEGSYVYFRNLIRSIELPTGLFLQGTYRNSAQGRRYYLAQITKDPWEPEEMHKVGTKYRLDPATCFSIHIEPQFNTLTGGFAVYLHYETNPYYPETWVRDNVVREDQAAYQQRRARFIDTLRQAPPPHFGFGGGRNQVGKLSVSLEGKTLQRAQTHLSALFAGLSTAVDRVLVSLG
jgi:hypothetical protein